jgi:hypothetical protein
VQPPVRVVGERDRHHLDGVLVGDATGGRGAELRPRDAVPVEQAEVLAGHVERRAGRQSEPCARPGVDLGVVAAGHDRRGVHVGRRQPGVRRVPPREVGRGEAPLPCQGVREREHAGEPPAAAGDGALESDQPGHRDIVAPGRRAHGTAPRAGPRPAPPAAAARGEGRRTAPGPARARAVRPARSRRRTRAGSFPRGRGDRRHAPGRSGRPVSPVRSSRPGNAPLRVPPVG